MAKTSQITFQKLVNKVDRHEETITQLLKIIASINRRIGEEPINK